MRRVIAKPVVPYRPYREARLGASAMSWRCLVVGAALGLDLAFGEVPPPVHPVVWMGRLIGAEQRLLPQRGPARQLVAGGILVGANVAIAAAAGIAGCRTLARLPAWLRLLAEGAVLSTLMSLRMLGREAGRVVGHVERHDLSGARLAARALVSRDTSELDGPLLLAAATESVAENASDSVVAPLLVYAVAGLPGAALYRMANTMDAMLGYHGAYEYLGKAAARLDDGLNWLPARITAALLVLASPLIGADGAGAWRVGRRDHRLTSSPNAGWPMSVAAGALGVRLEKRGHYVLGRELPLPRPAATRGAVRLLYAATGLFVALLGLLALAAQMSGRRGDRRDRRDQWDRRTRSNR